MIVQFSSYVFFLPIRFVLSVRSAATEIERGFEFFFSRNYKISTKNWYELLFVTTEFVFPLLTWDAFRNSKKLLKNLSSCQFPSRLIFSSKVITGKISGEKIFTVKIFIRRKKKKRNSREGMPLGNRSKKIYLTRINIITWFKTLSSLYSRQNDSGHDIKSNFPIREKPIRKKSRARKK